MTTLTRWNPFKEIDDINNHFSTFWGVPVARSQQREGSGSSSWAPRVDVSEDAEQYTISADIPELTKKDVAVRVEDGVLYISGERKRETVDENTKHHREERFFGSFLRTFQLPEDGDVGRVAADFKNGVLKVVVPKAEEKKPKAIEIKVA
jgi:HSP20 family protein